MSEPTPQSGALRAASKRSLEPQTANALEPREVAQYDAMIGVVDCFGPFDQEDAHYIAPSPFANVNCANCVFYEGAGACEIVAGQVDPAAVCKLWIIPETLLGAPEAPPLDDAAVDGTAADPMLHASSADRETRYRPLVGAEWRDATGTGDGSYTLTGYAAVYDTATTLYDGRSFRMDELISRGAFTRVLGEQPDVHLVVNHDMSRAVARTGVSGIGGLELREDATGLRVFARLDPADPDVQALASKMRRGVVDQMSFAFTVAADSVTTVEDASGKQCETRTILEIGKLFDVSVCAQGAYPQTTASIRSRIAAAEDRTLQGGSDQAIAAPAAAQGGDPTIAADASSVGGASSAKLKAAQARARLAALRHHLSMQEES